MQKVQSKKINKKVVLLTAMSVLLTAILVLSGVGIYFKLTRKENPTVEVNPLDFSYDTWDGTIEAVDFNEEYAGRAKQTKTINSAAAFAHFISEVNSGNDFANYTVYLNANIDLNGRTISSIGADGKTFKGTFDGGHYTILNAKVNGNGLFENTENATIKNVGLYNANVSLIHKAINTNVENCFVRLGNGKLINEYISNNGNHYVKNSFVDSEANGLVGSIDTNNSSENKVTISNSYFTKGEVAVLNKDANVTEEKVIKANNKSDFADWNYSAEYKTDKEWCDYNYLANSQKLDFVYPLQAGFVKVYLTGSCYESVVTSKNGSTIVDTTNLVEAFNEADKQEEAQVNLLVEKIFMEAKAEVANTNVTINAVKDTTIVRGENNTDAMFVGNGTSKIILGSAPNVSTASGSNATPATLTLDGNRKYFEKNNLDSGALVVANGGEVEIHDNVVIKNNVNNTTGYGGAVIVANAQEEVKIGARFENCSSTAGGGAVTIITEQETLTLSKSAEYINCSSASGGALYIANTLPEETVEEMRKLYGRNINIKPTEDYVERQTTLTELTGTNTFKGCKATYDGTTATTGYGGAIYCTTDFTISGTATFGGSAEGEGNSAIGGNYGYGGAIYCKGTLTINEDAEATFIGNSATGTNSGDGGAIYVKGNIIISGSATFGGENEGEGNSATEGGAIYCCSTSSTQYEFNITESGEATFIGNSATGTFAYGGAIYGTTTINGTATFTGNSATGTYGYGGAIYGTTTINAGATATFIENSARYGGAIYGLSTTTINGNVTLDDNYLSSYTSGSQGEIYGGVNLGADLNVLSTSGVNTFYLSSAQYITVKAPLTKTYTVYKVSRAVFTGDNTASYIFTAAASIGLTGIPFRVTNAPDGTGIDYNNLKADYGVLANGYNVTLNSPEATNHGTTSVLATNGSPMPTITPPTRTGYNFEGYYGGIDDTGVVENMSTSNCIIRIFATSQANYTEEGIGNDLLYCSFRTNFEAVSIDWSDIDIINDFDCVYRDGYYYYYMYFYYTGLNSWQHFLDVLTPDLNSGYTLDNALLMRQNVKHYNADGTSATTWDAARSVNLYAKWTKITYDVVLDADGGSVSPSSIEVTYNQQYPTLPTPIRDGYKFNGWMANDFDMYDFVNYYQDGQPGAAAEGKPYIEDGKLVLYSNCTGYWENDSFLGVYYPLSLPNGTYRIATTTYWTGGEEEKEGTGFGVYSSDHTGISYIYPKSATPKYEERIVEVTDGILYFCAEWSWGYTSYYEDLTITRCDGVINNQVEAGDTVTKDHNHVLVASWTDKTTPTITFSGDAITDGVVQLHLGESSQVEYMSDVDGVINFSIDDSEEEYLFVGSYDVDISAGQTYILNLIVGNETGTYGFSYSFTPTDTENYNNVTGGVSCSISKSIPVVTFSTNRLEIEIGKSGRLTYSVNCDGTFVFGMIDSYASIDMCTTEVTANTRYDMVLTAGDNYVNYTDQIYYTFTPNNSDTYEELLNEVGPYVDILPIKVDLPTSNTQQYTGEEQALYPANWDDISDYVYIDDSNGWGATDIGDYEVTIYLNDTSSTTWADGTTENKTVSVSIVPYELILDTSNMVPSISGTIAQWDIAIYPGALESLVSFGVQLYKDGVACGEPVITTNTSVDMTETLLNLGAGSYQFTVQALSSNHSLMTDSAETDLSEDVFYVTELTIEASTGIASVAFETSTDSKVRIDGTKATMVYSSTSATTVYANPTKSPGYTFDYWTSSPSVGSCYTSRLTYTMDINYYCESITYTAYSIFTGLTVTIVSADTTQGRVTESSVIVDSGDTATINGNKITLGGKTIEAIANAPTAEYTYSFANWSNADGAITSNRTITANFTATKNKYTITIDLNNSDYGSLESSTGELTFEVEYGKEIEIEDDKLMVDGVVITALPSATGASEGMEYVLDSWFGASSTVSGNMTITATFVEKLKIYQVTIIHNNYGTVSRETMEVEHGSRIFATDNVLTIGSNHSVAVPLESTNVYKYTFDGWIYAGTTVTADIEITAEFSRNSQVYNIKISATNGSISGATIVDGVATVSVNYGAEIFVQGNVIKIDDNGNITTITATANSGYVFQKWVGVVGVVEGNISITANFRVD